MADWRRGQSFRKPRNTEGKGKKVRTLLRVEKRWRFI